MKQHNGADQGTLMHFAIRNSGENVQKVLRGKQDTENKVPQIYAYNFTNNEDLANWFLPSNI